MNSYNYFTKKTIKMKNLFDNELTIELINNDLDLNKLHNPTYQRECAAFLNLYDLFSIKNNINIGNEVGCIYDGITYLEKDTKGNYNIRYSYKKFAEKNLRKYPYEILRRILGSYIRKDNGDKTETLTKSMMKKKSYFTLSKGVYSHIHGSRSNIYVRLIKDLCDILLRDENGDKPELKFIYK